MTTLAFLGLSFSLQLAGLPFIVIGGAHESTALMWLGFATTMAGTLAPPARRLTRRVSDH
jgi:hypothetical protein